MVTIYMLRLHMSSATAESGHSSAGGGARARQLSNHHAARLDQLLDMIGDKPISTNDAMLALFPFDMTGHEVFFASCEARAHLNHLVTTGYLQRQESKNGVDIFVKC